MKWQSWGSLVLGLAMGASAWAQPLGGVRSDDNDRASGDRDRRGRSADKRSAGPMRLGDSSPRGPAGKTRGFGGGRGQKIDPSVLKPERLIKELKLEYQQGQEVEKIFREYNAAVAEVKQKHVAGDLKREQERLERDLKSARQMGDTQRAKDIWTKLNELRRSADDDMAQMQEMLIEEIEKILDDGQKVQFRQMLRPGNDRGRRAGPLHDPQVLAQCLQQVKLEDYQKTRLEQIRRDYEERVKYRKDMRPEEKEQMQKQALNEVMMLLNDKQKEELQRAHTKMSGPGAGGGKVDLTDARQFYHAIRSLSKTENRLSREQQTEMGKIRMEFYKEMRNLPKGDDEARKRHNEQMMQEMLNVLTPEQQEAIKEMEMPAGRFRGRRGGRGGRTGSPTAPIRW